MEAPKSYYICLSSASCLETFPDNKGSAFTNQLPFELKNTYNNRFYIQLKKIGICTKGKSAWWTQSFSYVKVHIYEIEKQTEGMNSTHFAGGFSFPPEEQCSHDYAMHTFRQAPQLLIRFQQLHKLTVKLTDENNQDILVPFGSPTILWLELTDMEPKDEFIITCLSKQPDMYPGNLLHSFISPLPTEMTMKNYEVALMQLVYPPELQEKVMASLKIGDLMFEYNLSEMATTEDFIEAVQKDISESKYNNLIKFKRLRHGPSKGHLTFVMRWVRGVKTPITVEPSPNFTKVCGQTLTPRAKTILRPGKLFIFDGQPDIRLGQENPVAMLQCDIIDPNIMCGKQAQLLHCVPVLTNKPLEGQRLYESTQLAFHRVANYPINRIGLKFTNPDGTHRNFKASNPDDCVIISLLFRRRK